MNKRISMKPKKTARDIISEKYSLTNISKIYAKKTRNWWKVGQKEEQIAME